MTPSPKPKPKQHRTSARSHSRAKPGSIRIISGKHRGRKLPVLLAEGLRPTADRVKETLFNWLMQDVSGARVLDMFAGAGSLGFEAISRNAAFVMMLENNRKSALQLEQNIELLTAKDCAEIRFADAFEEIKKISDGYDIVFIDPPFHQGLVKRALDSIIENKILKADALVYIESEASLEESNPSNLHKIKENTTQQVNYRLYRYFEE